MHVEPPSPVLRELKETVTVCDLVVVGGGMAGVCAAITAARQGLQVTLVQDRPVLGGNASSEVRLWVLGATSHGYNNNRWAREGGVIDELLVENLWRNPEGNPVIFDTVLLDAVVREPKLTLLLNTAVFSVEKDGPDRIRAVRAFCSQNSTLHVLRAPLFCDASGDGVVGFLAGAAFRMGAEPAAEFNEPFAPNQAFGELLGHSIYFYSKDAGRPVAFTPPSFALKELGDIKRHRSFKLGDQGCQFWWIEYGGRLDTVHDTEAIKWELWRVVYGVWHHIKNSGEYPDAANLTLEWVGTIPGKRESRRFEGDYVLRQTDVIEPPGHPDVVAYGGWALDLHPSDGVYSDIAGCTHWQAKSVYGIPYRCYYSRNLENLFLAGRLISASHVAFGSSRVMATCAHGGQAVGVAAALCRELDCSPAALSKPDRVRHLQARLLRTGQYLPGVPDELAHNLTTLARVEASSTFHVTSLAPDGPLLPLTRARAQLVPAAAGPVPAVTFFADCTEAGPVTLELRRCSRSVGFTPDVLLATKTVTAQPGHRTPLTASFETSLPASAYLFYIVRPRAGLALHTSQTRVTGLLSLTHQADQKPPPDIGVDAFEMWCPTPRPGGHNLACEITGGSPQLFAPGNVANGRTRPTTGPNGWVADPADTAPTLTLTWPQPIQARTLTVWFDNDADHPIDSVLIHHPERALPFCPRRFIVRGDENEIWAEVNEHHHSSWTLRWPEARMLSRLTIEILEMNGRAPAAIMEVCTYRD